VIRSFRDSETERLFHDERVLRFRGIERVARRKLLLLNAARKLDDLQVPPGNRLEALRGDRHGTYSIRVNDRFRVCFTWKDGEANDVAIVDYH
jgi:proteic killer suppression protein